MEYFILVGVASGLVVYSTAVGLADAETFQSNMVAKTFISRSNRDYDRGSRFW